MHLHRSVGGSRDRCWWPETFVYPEAEFCKGLGTWLPSTDHQTDTVLGGSSSTPCLAAAGRGPAHYAPRWPWTCQLTHRLQNRKALSQKHGGRQTERKRDTDTCTDKQWLIVPHKHISLHTQSFHSLGQQSAWTDQCLVHSWVLLIWLSW